MNNSAIKATMTHEGPQNLRNLYPSYAWPSTTCLTISTINHQILKWNDSTFVLRPIYWKIKQPKTANLELCNEVNGNITSRCLTRLVQQSVCQQIEILLNHWSYDSIRKWLHMFYGVYPFKCVTDFIIINHLTFECFLKGKFWLKCAQGVLSYISFQKHISWYSHSQSHTVHTLAFPSAYGLHITVCIVLLKIPVYSFTSTN